MRPRTKPSQQPQSNNGAVETRTNALPVHPWIMPAFEPTEAVAMRAFVEGGATPEQQGQVLTWLIWATRHASSPVVADTQNGFGVSHDAMIFIAGQQAIAQWITTLAQWRPARTSDISDEHGLGTGGS